MQISQNILRVLGRSAMLAAFAGATTLGLHAQQADGGERPNGVFYVQPEANDSTSTVGYSSSAGEPETAAAVNFLSTPGIHAMQPPPRRYGRRPIYADSAHNADGSSKYTFFGGAGFTVPTGGTHNYFSPSYGFQVGGGRNFNKKLALLLQFDWANFGIQDNTLNAEQAIYKQFGITQTDGHGHIWSFTLDPMYTFAQGEKTGAYVVGGIGFYHKITDFTTPTTVEYFDPYYGEIEFTSDQTFDSYVSNSFGVNGGVGFTYKPSRFGNEKFYGEARYVYTDNQPKPFYDSINGTNPSSNPNYFNVFPQNSAKSTYIPVTFGIRF